MPRLSSALPCLLALALASSARAQETVPMLVSNEGFLLDANDAPVNQRLDMTFGIYEDGEPTHAPTPIWSETYSVLVSQGYYAVLLGDTRAPNNGKQPLPPTVFAAANRWVGVKLDGMELLPRMRLATVPFASRAHSAATVDAGAIGTAQVKDGAVTLAKLALTDGKFVGLNADTLDGLDAAAFAPAAIEAKVDAIKASVGDGLAVEVGAAKAASMAAGSKADALAATLGTPPSGSSLAAELAAVKAGEADTNAKAAAIQAELATVKTATNATNATLGAAPSGSTLAAELAAIRTALAAQGSARTYSLDCTDFAAKGWASRKECLQDGRWHKFGTWTGGSAVPAADLALVQSLADAGADFKVQWPTSVYKSIFPVWYVLPYCDGAARICLYTHKPVGSVTRTVAVQLRSDTTGSGSGYWWYGVGADGSFSSYVGGSGSDLTGTADVTLLVRN